MKYGTSSHSTTSAQLHTGKIRISRPHFRFTLSHLNAYSLNTCIIIACMHASLSSTGCTGTSHGNLSWYYSMMRYTGCKEACTNVLLCYDDNMAEH